VAAAGIGGSPFGQVSSAIGSLACRLAADARQGDSVLVAVRPENIEINPVEINPVEIDPGRAAQAGANTVAGQVESIAYLGNLVNCAIRAGQEQIHVQTHPCASLAAGERVMLRLPADQCLVMPAA
jgi:hypothetical protein